MTSPLFSHADTNRVTVSLGSLLSPVAPFNKVLLIDAFANSSLAGFGDEVSLGTASTKYVELGALADATAANTASAGSVGTALLADLTGAFSHSRAPDSIGVLSVDRADGGNGVDTYAAAISLLVNAGYNDFYCVIPVSHVLADIVDILEGVMAVASASRPRIVFAQTAVSTSYGSTAGWDAALVNSSAAAPSTAAKERLVMCYHADTQPCAVGYATWGFGYDPDTRSLSWRFENPAVADVTLPSGVSATTFKQNLRGVPGTDLGNEINVPLPYGASTTWMDPGVTQTGRAIYSVIAADWFQARLEERLATLVTAHAPNKVPMSKSGQALILQEIEQLYSQGVAAGHFLSRADATDQGLTVTIRAETITSTDRSLRRLRFTVAIPVLHDARVLAIDVTITE